MEEVSMSARRLNFRWISIVSAAACSLLMLVAVFGLGIEAQERTVWDGVYTEEQSKRGMNSYEQECAQCHLEDLLGDGIAPSLIGAPFHFRWSDLSVGDMLVAIRTTMPQGAPASLSPRAYSDIVAYLLQVNEFPAGDTELPTGVDELETIIIQEDAP